VENNDALLQRPSTEAVRAIVLKYTSRYFLMASKDKNTFFFLRTHIKVGLIRLLSTYTELIFS